MIVIGYCSTHSKIPNLTVVQLNELGETLKVTNTKTRKPCIKGITGPNLVYLTVSASY
jgi:hypothetical protein